jgi:hypothetical protein
MNQDVATLPAPTMQWPMQATERMQLCRELSTSRLIPPAFQKSPADIFLVLNTCERLKLDFFLTIGECYVISGKVGFSGKLAAAIINSSRRMGDRLAYHYEGEEGTDDRTVVVSGRLQGESDFRTVRVQVGMVRTKNEQWTKQPDQMLAYSGSRIWGRRHCPEVLLGMLFADELEDMIDITPKKEPQYAEKGPLQAMAETGSTKPMTDIGSIRPKPPTAAERPPIEKPVEREREEPYSLEPPELVGVDTTEAWHAWCQTFVNLVRASTTVEEIDRWLNVNFDTLETLKAQEPKMWRGVENAIVLRRMTLEQPQGPPQ